MSIHPKPATEIEVDVPLVRALLESQMPDLAPLSLTAAGSGWDNQVFRLGDRLAVRLPQRQTGARLMAHEQRWLPTLAARLPLPIAAPIRCGRPQGRYPWAWSIVPWIEGDVAATAEIRDSVAAARSVGTFLAALHTEAPDNAPVNPHRSVQLSDRADLFSSTIQALAGVVDVCAVSEAWQLSLGAPAASGPPVWIHGDFHPGNVIVANGRIAGVIDFGDLAAGDRATDLAIAWMLFEAAEREVLREAADGIDDATWIRARGWAIALGMAHLAHSADAPLHEAIGRRTIKAVLDELG